MIGGGVFNTPDEGEVEEEELEEKKPVKKEILNIYLNERFIY